MKNKELLNNIIAVTSARSVIQETKYTYEDVIKISEEYAKQMCIEQRELCADNLPYSVDDMSDARIACRETKLATDKQ